MTVPHATVHSVVVPRLAEWITTFVLINLAFSFREMPMEMARYITLMEFATPEQWFKMCVLLGVFRASVLVVNGTWRRSPHLRAIGSGLSCLVWTQFLLSGTDALSYAVAPVLIVADIINIIRAMRDARWVDDAFRELGGGSE